MKMAVFWDVAPFGLVDFTDVSEEFTVFIIIIITILTTWFKIPKDNFIQLKRFS
jgi:hypothetical protein